jgi:aryl-alcohol dehydrogenase-like predicted oxidoreductase
VITGGTKTEQVLANAAAADWVLSVDGLDGLEGIEGIEGIEEV